MGECDELFDIHKKLMRDWNNFQYCCANDPRDADSCANEYYCKVVIGYLNSAIESVMMAKESGSTIDEAEKIDEFEKKEAGVVIKIDHDIIEGVAYCGGCCDLNIDGEMSDPPEDSFCAKGWESYGMIPGPDCPGPCNLVKEAGE